LNGSALTLALMSGVKSGPHIGSVMTGLNKRKQERFDLELPAILKLAEEESEQIEVITKDVCSGGALFHTDQPIDIGTEVSVELAMPIAQLKQVKADRVLIRVAGAVIRTDQNGIAVCFEKKYTVTPVSG
jgi:hypothetical protein